MTLEELRIKISSIVQMEAIGLNVYFLLDTEQGQVLKRANIRENVKANLVKAYQLSLNLIIANEDLTMIDLSAADDRQTAIYLYDLEEQPAVFNYFEIVQNDNDENPIPLFNFDTDVLGDFKK